MDLIDRSTAASAGVPAVSAAVPAASAAVIAAFRQELSELMELSGLVDQSHLSRAGAAADCDAERIELVAELERLKGCAAAAQARLTAAFAASQGLARDLTDIDSDIRRPVGAQVGLSRHESPAQGDRLVGVALTLVADLPRTLSALEQGLVSEWTATVVAREAAHLDPRQRHELDERLAPDLHRLSTRQARRAAQHIVADIDAEAVQRRMRAARRNRRVSMRVVGDGMAYLSILGTTTDVAGAHASLRQHATAVLHGALGDEQAAQAVRDGADGIGAVMSDTALQRLSGRAPSEAQPVAVNIVMTDRSLLGWGEQSLSREEPALIPGIGAVPADFARELLADPRVEAFYRRLFTSPDGRDLVAMDARSRCFPSGLRTMVVLRDQRCRTPYCDAPIAEIDHVRPHRDGGLTSYDNGMGLCRRCNLTKEARGYRVQVGEAPAPAQAPAPAPAPEIATHPPSTPRARPSIRHRVHPPGTHRVHITTPSQQQVTSTAPPLLGWGWRGPPDEDMTALPGTPVESPERSRDESPAERAVRLALAA